LARKRFEREREREREREEKQCKGDSRLKLELKKAFYSRDRLNR